MIEKGALSKVVRIRMAMNVSRIQNRRPQALCFASMNQTEPTDSRHFLSHINDKGDYSTLSQLEWAVGWLNYGSNCVVHNIRKD